MQVKFSRHRPEQSKDDQVISRGPPTLLLGPAAAHRQQPPSPCRAPLDVPPSTASVLWAAHHIQPHARHPGRTEARSCGQPASYIQKAALPAQAVINEGTNPAG